MISVDFNAIDFNRTWHMTEALKVIEQSSTGQSSDRISGIEMTPGGQDVDYMTIEGMRGQEYSVGIFIFMLVGVVVFIVIIISFMKMASKNNSMRRGELILFLWIMIGTLVAVAFGATQLLSGRLF